MRTVKLAVAAVVAALFALPMAGHAQTANKAQLYRFSPKQGAQADVETALKKHARWREENGDPWSWGVWQVVQGDHVGDFIVRSGGHSWADWDSYMKGFGATGAEHFGANVGPLLANEAGYVEAADSAMVHWPEDMGTPALVEVIDFHLDPSRASGWWDAIQKFHEAIGQEAPDSYYHLIAYPVAGADGYGRLVIPHDSWADFEEPERGIPEIMKAAYGEEEAGKIEDAFTSAIRYSTSMVLQYRPDMSVEGSGGGM